MHVIQNNKNINLKILAGISFFNDELDYYILNDSYISIDAFIVIDLTWLAISLNINKKHNYK